MARVFQNLTPPRLPEDWESWLILAYWFVSVPTLIAGFIVLSGALLLTH